MKRQLSLKKLSGTSFLLGLEVITCVQVLLAGIVKLQAILGKWRPRLRILGSNVPSVDILIPVCKEPLDLIQDTVRATLHLDYPQNRYRVIVTDDGKSALLKSWVEQLARRYPSLYYTSRDSKGDWKAGNLNHAIKFAESLPGGRAEYLAGLDADMIPERKWLRAVVPHMLQNPKAGVVCPAQLFYNVPKNDPLVQSRLREWRCTNIVGDLTGNGWNLGSGWVIRPEVLEKIGGFSGHSLVEDVYSTFLMQAEGYETIYLTEALQFGLVPTSYSAHLNQFTRWYIGGAQIFFRFNGFLDGRKTKKMPLLTRIMGFQDGIWAHFNCHLNTITWFLTPFFFLSNTNMAYWRDENEMLLLLRLHCAITLLRYAHNYIHGLLSGYRVSMHTQMIAYMMPYYSIVWLRSFILPKSLGGKVTSFIPTGVVVSPIHEREASRRAPVLQRLRHILIDCGAWLHLVTALAFVICVGIHVNRATGAYPPTNDGRRLLFINLIQTIGWPSHPWFINAIACLGPLRYALFPPDVPPRESFFGKKDANDVRYITQGEKKSTCTSGFYSPWEFGYVQLYTLFMIYVAVLFVLSWLI
ncbi:nucleotide-diphospho-sugar transferase [Tricladium varicosporioides]|nr:nucleotide-diphospho-sugar transferase [Hymenoscyphus varicosporioides]